MTLKESITNKALSSGHGLQHMFSFLPPSVGLPCTSGTGDTVTKLFVTTYILTLDRSREHIDPFQ